MQKRTQVKIKVKNNTIYAVVEVTQKFGTEKRNRKKKKTRHLRHEIQRRSFVAGVSPEPSRPYEGMSLNFSNVENQFLSLAQNITHTVYRKKDTHTI